MTGKRFVTNGVTIRDRGNDKTYRIMTHNSELMEFLEEVNALHEENNRFKQAFEKTMEDAFDRNMDSKIAEEVIDYIHDSFYEFLKLEDLE